ncbi:hypothetical protein D3C71_2058750 [compost metagenome]
MNVVAVSDVRLIGNTRNDTKPILQVLREFVCSRFHGRAIQGKVNVFLTLPDFGGTIQVLQDFQRERGSLRVCVRFSGHVFYTLIESCIPQ